MTSAEKKDELSASLYGDVLMSVQLPANCISPHCVHAEFSKLDHSRVLSSNGDHSSYRRLPDDTPTGFCAFHFLSPSCILLLS